jgi:DNA-binding transcriptional LysR family regulator
VVGDVARILSALRSGEVDAALLTEHTMPRDIETATYARGRTVLIAAAGEPEPARPMTLADLAERTLVVRDPGTVNRREVDQLLEQAGVEPAGRLEASSLEAVKRCVEAGLGVAIVPGIAVERELALGTLRELPMERPAMEFGFCLAWRRGEPVTPPVAMLLDLLREQGEQPAPVVAGAA